LRDAFKVFILFKTSGIKSFDYSLGIYKNFLDDESKKFQLEKILSPSKDTISVADFDGQFSSNKGIYIEKLYARLWVNLILNDDDFTYILEYITLFERIDKEIRSDQIDLAYKYIIDHIKNSNFDVLMFDLNYTLYLKTYARIGILERKKLLERKISFPIYYILKLYIDSKLKQPEWKEIKSDVGIANGKMKDKIYRIPAFGEIKISENELFDMTVCEMMKKKVMEILKIKNNKHDFTEDNIREIFDVIFPGDRRTIKQKRRQLENNFDKIFLLYCGYKLKKMINGIKMEKEFPNEFILFSHIFFRIKDKDVEFKCTEAGQTGNDRTQIRGEKVNTCLGRILKHEVETKYLKKYAINNEILEIMDQFFMEYVISLRGLDIQESMGKIGIQNSDIPLLINNIMEGIRFRCQELWKNAKKFNQGCSGL